ncbi:MULTISPECIES: hypothetical protein [unclassified Tolypothrix]|uniref:hypothetical protein n=1 Tax=unclassified Tolypothrix TaxID=2649714 RepID=UPI0005EAC61A|nr:MULTISPECIES: hypothetical protein [unclassified Tolypothrix]BAY94734.1 hypothetical protein NIES3275_67860 [Microchaete diplosiphon NIES-3275]EKE99031.1 hypothetical protein FDUTEX481_03222 [Tolypothrix sp. PCC 7601]MBE9081357.1 hypothetical protein [Tolypothrix sp. LEGE 11397]UYD28423.1 hypothetical protein HGR01_10485 [Tolypothrix sp. PCC 7712]UYD35698.1 hypothetical protein HG267_08075 [Tolypothrix sp. PCC 7601]
MSDRRPGLNPHRLVSLVRQAVEGCDLQLQNAIVLTEAATGAYAVTPIVAAIAGAEKVLAIAKTTRYGTVEQVQALTKQLADIAGVSDRIEFIAEKTPDIVAQADIITNSGHVRPINAEMIGWMKPNAVIGLMYEAWEFRPEDLDLITCRLKGIQVVGVNERHPAVDVFSFLGIMAVKQLLDAGISVYTSNILLLCDNPFQRFIERGLVQAGATVDTVDSLATASINKNYDAILVALQPRLEPILGAKDAAAIAKYWTGTLVAQYWGDIERSAFAAQNIPVSPEIEPKPGHMGILPSAVGPEPIVRLQTGGLKAAEVIWRQSFQPQTSGLEFVQLL